MLQRPLQTFAHDCTGCQELAIAQACLQVISEFRQPNNNHTIQFQIHHLLQSTLLSYLDQITEAGLGNEVPP